MIVFAEFFVNGKSTGFYWLDHTNEEHRKCLGHRCAIAFAEGTDVFTASVQKVGVLPVHRPRMITTNAVQYIPTQSTKSLKKSNPFLRPIKETVDEHGNISMEGSSDW